MKILIILIYSGDLNSELVGYSNGPQLFDPKVSVIQAMAWITNKKYTNVVAWIKNKYFLIKILLN